MDLHPIVRRYTYERLTMPDRIATHARLQDYFAAVNVHLKKSRKTGIRAPVIELYHHIIRAGNLDQAMDLAYDRLADLYCQFRAYQTYLLN